MKHSKDKRKTDRPVFTCPHCNATRDSKYALKMHKELCPATGDSKYATFRSS